MTKPITEIVEEFNKNYFTGDGKALACGFNGIESEDWLTTTLEADRKAVWEQAIEECIELSDYIELSEPDGGTKQWMAFKAFRNTLRDRLKALTNSK